MSIHRGTYDMIIPLKDTVLSVLVALLILLPTLPSRLGITHGQDVSSVVDVDHSGAASITDRCHDPLTPPALREALRLVCLRERVQITNRGIQNATILGFVGGFVERDDVKHPKVLFATYLRSRS